MAADPSPPSSELLAGLERLARFSGLGRGVTRLVYDEAWCAAHHWLVAAGAERGLNATSDWAGNLLFHDPAHAPGPDESPVVLVGSHLDSVVEGGTLDGAYGMWSGLLIAAACRGAAGGGKARGRSPATRVVAFATCEEEGSRFPGTMMGARALLGKIEPGELDAMRDFGGATWREVLTAARVRGCAAPLPASLPGLALRSSAMIELHIEQGPRLEQEGIALGIVEAIAGYCRFDARITGAPAHAGTTPMSMRRDALAAAAELTIAVERLALERGDPAVATVGDARAHPGLFNVVAGRADLRIELRHTAAATLGEMKADLERRVQAIAEARRVEIRLAVVAEQPPAPMDASLVERAERLASEMKITHRRMASGAGHDAMVFARAGIPTVMVFVPSRGGVSHSPDEHTAPEALELGHRFTLELVRGIAAGAA